MHTQEQTQQNVRDTAQRRGFQIIDLVFWGVLLSATVYLVLVVAGVTSNRLSQTEIILIAAVLVLNPALISRISDFEISPTRVRIKLDEVASRVQTQQADIDKLKFLMAHFLSNYELQHLKKLDSGKPFPYFVQGQFQDELRRLRSLKLINMGTISRMPAYGDLCDLASITDEGKQYLTWARDG